MNDYVYRLIIEPYPGIYYNWRGRVEYQTKDQQELAKAIIERYGKIRETDIEYVDRWYPFGQRLMSSPRVYKFARTKKKCEAKLRRFIDSYNASEKVKQEDRQKHDNYVRENREVILVEPND